MTRVSDSSPIFIGIDGGGTGTRALAASAAGYAVAQALAGPSNPNNDSFAEAAASIARCLRELDLPSERVAGICAGIAGVGNAEATVKLATALAAAAPEFSAVPCRITHDLEIAWQGAFGGGDGLCVIAGTGSACYARLADGQALRVSGRSIGRDDPGSGYAIARAGIECGVLESETPLERMERSAIAALAPRVIAAAEQSDAAALAVLQTESAKLADLIAEGFALFASRARGQIAFVGGLICSSPLYRNLVVADLRVRCPQAAVVAPLASPLAGAVQLARRLREM